MRSRTFLILSIVCAAGLLLAQAARAVITVLIPLGDMNKQDFIFIAKVKEILSDKPAMVMVFDEHLKGKAPFERMPINLTGNAEAKKGKHTEVLLDRIDKDLPIIVMTKFVGGKHIALCFTNGTWFSMHGRIEKEDGKEVVRWTFQSCEPYLRRTFKGTTADLKQIVVDMVEKKKDPPAPDEKEKPGYGPAIQKNSGLPGTLARS